jgi:hypothetical protein
VGRNPPAAGGNGTSPEIPDTVDADPYATAGKAGAAARPGQSGRASTGALAVGTQGREADGTREIPPSPRAGAAGADPKGNRRGSGRVGSRIGLYYRRSGGKPRGGKGPTDQRVGGAAHGGHTEAHSHVPVAPVAPLPGVLV